MHARNETPPPRRCPTSGDEWTRSPVSKKPKEDELITSPIAHGKALWTPAQDSCISSQSSPSTRASSLLLSPASQQRSAGKENRAPRISGTPSRLPTVQENDGMPVPEEAARPGTAGDHTCTTSTTIPFGKPWNWLAALSLLVAWFSPNKSAGPLQSRNYNDFGAYSSAAAVAQEPRSDPPQGLWHGTERALLQDFEILAAAPKGQMAAPSSHTGGVPLEEWRKDIPPGWRPGMEAYPLKLYFAKLKLWYRCAEVPDEMIGPLVAGRLAGAAQRIALELKLVRPDGQFDVGDAALVRLSVDQVIDPADGTTILQHAIPSGVQALCNALREAFGESDDTQVTKALESFFEYRRPPALGLQEFAAEWELRFEDARARAGLEMNNVAKTYMWMKQACIPQRHQDDLKLQIHGDLSRFNEVRQLALRLAHRVDKGGSGDVFFEENMDHSEPYEQWPDETYWTDDWWTDDSWSVVEEPYEDAYWYEEDSYYDDHSWNHSPDAEPGHQGGDDVQWDQGEGIYSAGGYRPGKGRGKSKGNGPFGTGCFICGSRWHLAADCPVRGKSGQGKGKGWKGGKSKSRFGSKGKAKGKGKGKGKWSKGYGKPRYYMDERSENQLRHAREGLHLGMGDTPPKQTATQYFNMSDEHDMPKSAQADDLLRLSKAAPHPAKEQYEDNPETAEPVAKNLTFFFRKHEDGEEVKTPRHRTHYGEDSHLGIYHTVQGRRRRGLIIDPGAANGLIGSETLRDLLSHVDMAEKVERTVEWSEKKSEVTGISGSADTTLGEVKIGLPMLRGLSKASYVADVVGGEASCCPALVGNPALVNMGATIAANWFTNKDGLLIVPNDQPNSDDEPYVLLRLLYTDSRHYMLPLDEQTSANEEKHRAQTFLTTISKSASRSKAAAVYDVCSWSVVDHDGPSFATSSISQEATSTAQDEAYFQTPSTYPGDSFPDHMLQPQTQRLERYYSGMKEEYYTKSAKAQITPRNFSRWRQTRGSTGPVQLWELFSGSARLSYMALLAGLAVAFPVDLRYGWDLSVKEHQDMILQAQELMDPKVMVMSPSCAPWVTTAKDLTEAERDNLRAHEHEALKFVKVVAGRQADRGRAFVVEQPWTSSGWRHSPLATLQQDFRGCRPRQRTDLCCFGAMDRGGLPLLKATGLQGNISLRNLTKRCQGHRVGHGTLRGPTDRPSTAFPQMFCKAFIKDVTKYLKTIDERPAGVFAADRDRPRSTSSSSKDPAVIRNAVTTPLPQLLEEFKQAATKRENLDDVKVNWPDGVTVSDSVNVISEEKGKHNHWTQDPVHLAVLRKVFGRVLDVKGVCTSLQTETYPLPMPFLRTESAPYRVIVRGEVKNWVVKKAEDLRTMTTRQLNEKIYCEDWVIAIFGSTAKDKDYWEVDRVKGKATRHHIQPRTAMFTPREDEGPVSMEELSTSRTTVATPYDKPGPKVVIKDDWTTRDSSRAAIEQGRWTGTSEFEILVRDEDPRDDDPVVRISEEHESAMDREEQAAEGEDIDDGQAIDPPKRANFDFRRVLVRLPRLARDDPQQAKRLLLGLHERFWHANSSDLQTMLSRAGMPAEVVKLVPETIAACGVCRKFSRLKSRPKVRADHPTSFNEEVQVDYFRLWDHWFMMIVDVATRYKTIVQVQGRDLPTALRALLQHWLRFFGPMKVLVSDQESCLMSHEAAAEFERLNIARSPAGTTRGGAQGQHTTTGVVEKHTDLAKITMMKLRAEAECQGMDIDYGDLAAEASFAQNATLNVGGYTPHMMVTGSLPMPFYDIDAPGIQAISGASQVSTSVYERALRLRQLALTAATQSIMENRIARASHTRPQRTPLEDLKSGVSEVEFHREDADGFGWRGPARLLKLQDNGSAIVEYQGRPYLIPLRNLRSFRGVYHSHYNLESAEANLRSQELDSWTALRRLMQSTEATVPFRVDTFGYLKNSSGTWVRIPKTMATQQQNEIYDDIVLASKFLTDKECHGIQVAVGVKKIHPHPGTTGTLVAWRRRTMKMSIADNPKGTTMSTVPFRIAGREDMCYIYFYSYAPNFIEITPDTWRPKGLPLEESPVVPISMEEDGDSREPPQKRDGPETRTVTIGPESKKQRILAATLPTSEFMGDQFLYMHRNTWKTRIPEEASDEPLDMNYNEVADHRRELFYMKSAGWHADIATGNIFRVDSTTDNIEEDQVYDIWPQVEEADAKEIAQFVAEDAFEPKKLVDLPANCAVIDGIWVRKWKRGADLKRVVKSRMCVRGCHDPWKSVMNNRSSTATRLSQRLILVAASNNDDDVESWDVAGAFLKGLTYKELWKCLKELGLHTVERLIAIVPPHNVWRHLRKLSKKFAIPEDDLANWVLLCLKPVYGLSEAPLAWQLFLHKFLRELGGIQSHFDECFWYWAAPKPGRWPTSSLTTHVDDLAARGKRTWLDNTFELMVKKFGKLTRQKLPFMHCGCKYSRTTDGFKVDQRDYVEMLQPAELGKDDDENRDLTPTEVTSLRSIVGGLMWTSLTRPDVLAELSSLQSAVTKAKVKHLRSANELISRAKEDKDAAIYYREGVLIVLMSDTVDIHNEHIVCDDNFVSSNLSGRAQLLHVQSTKAKRVSYSTSHGETLAAIAGLEAATLVSTRLAEITYGGRQPSLQELLAIQETGSSHFPVDAHTDCRDFFELSTGARTLPQDKSQRLYIMAHREARASGRLRWVILTPTECMTADALTKTMVSPCMMHWLSTGTIRFWNCGHPLEMKRLPPPSTTFDEDDLIAGDTSLRKGRTPLPLRYTKHGTTSGSTYDRQLRHRLGPNRDAGRHCFSIDGYPMRSLVDENFGVYYTNLDYYAGIILTVDFKNHDLLDYRTSIYADANVPLVAAPLSPVSRPIPGLDLVTADPPVKNTFIHIESPNKTRALRSPPKTEPPSFAPESGETQGHFQGVPFPPTDPACLSLAGSFDAVGDQGYGSDRGLTVRISDYLPELPEGPRQSKGLPLRIADYMPAACHEHGIGSDMEGMPGMVYGGQDMYCYQTPSYQTEAPQQLPAQMLAALHSPPMEQFMAQLQVDPMQVQHYVAQMLQMQGPAPQAHGDTMPAQQHDDCMCRSQARQREKARGLWTGLTTSMLAELIGRRTDRVRTLALRAWDAETVSCHEAEAQQQSLEAAGIEDFAERVPAVDGSTLDWRSVPEAVGLWLTWYEVLCRIIHEAAGHECYLVARTPVEDDAEYAEGFGPSIFRLLDGLDRYDPDWHACVGFIRSKSRMQSLEWACGHDFSESLPTPCASADTVRRVRFQEPHIIEVASWKDATRLMQHRGKKKIDEEEFMLGALSSLPHRVAFMAALTPMVLRFAIGIVDTVM
ncbi:hypothetical protein AK812_SmicGene1358 [Symbiodinium microadriaticum]|uniref:Copia protein n=1 Tax=Symbiodinium microadriaticum TaxID=2951 RepID=A0A1Q9F4A9_SYMMI|nr:hypothetical protein AK812_SmicGene1358 [Symbiodinium microadriaticum]